MKQYLLFTYNQYYPQGGMNDFTGSFNTLQEAADSIICKEHQGRFYKDCVSFQIVDCVNGSVINTLENLKKMLTGTSENSIVDK